MKNILFRCLSLGIIVVSGCGSSSNTVQYSDDTPTITTETIEDTSKPTVVTEIPTTTSEEIVTQADTSL